MGKNSFFSSNLFINTRGKLLDLRSPCIMSILNLTPDSFYDGGSNSNADRLLKKAETDLSSGAGILDLGAWSSRPGSIPISVAQEWARLEPALKSIRKNFPDAIISIDTYRAEIVTMAAAEGADMINDISAGNLDENMLESVANSGLPYVLMHMRGNSLTMTELNDYDDLLTDISKFFRDTLEIVRQAGITDITTATAAGTCCALMAGWKCPARRHPMSCRCRCQMRRRWTRKKLLSLHCRAATCSGFYRWPQSTVFVQTATSIPPAASWPKTAKEKSP